MSLPLPLPLAGRPPELALAVVGDVVAAAHGAAVAVVAVAVADRLAVASCTKRQGAILVLDPCLPNLW